MARKFTRIEFEDGSVVVVKADENTVHSNEYTILGNRTSSWRYPTHVENASYGNLVDSVIDNTDIKVVRTISHSLN
ncbi:hypothetical protein DI392_14090 [Vibrio albus]|uniref:Uncharacterized protein n=1 Tax=Vibrio albus TaxID=2200953 RepID=A0A2U3B754_9VIBR|nr:hypothetical protein DI392_14090 [Vibrio albus]